MNTIANSCIKNDYDGDSGSSLRYRHLTCEIAENAEFARNHFVVIINCSEFGGDILPGQFVNLKCDNDKYGKLYRPFSVMQFDKQTRQIEIYYHVVGEGSRWLAKQKPGANLKMLLPLGNSFSVPKEARYIALVAGGVGVAPLLYLNNYLKSNDRNIEVTFLMGARTLQGLCLPLFERYGIEPVCATDDGTFGEKGLVTDLLVERMKLCSESAEGFESGDSEDSTETIKTPDYVAACGPTSMMAAVQKICAGRAVGEASLEERMACGIGACMGCVARIKDDDGIARYAAICNHGPVVRLDRVEF